MFLVCAKAVEATEAREAARTGREPLGIRELADHLRYVAANELIVNASRYRNFYVGRMRAEHGQPRKKRRGTVTVSYDQWAHSIRGSEQCDDLVVAALARACSIAVQVISKSGYDVPIIDPCNVAQEGRIVYGGK